MISELAMQLALRSKAMTLAVAATGPITMSATATGYARTAGSFAADGLMPGMEVTVAGFASNGPAVITEVAPLSIKARRVISSVVNGVTVYTLAAPPVEAAAAARSLTVGLPTQRVWENRSFESTQGIPWVREEFIPGPTSQVTIGPFGELETTPMYALYINVPAETGLAGKYYVDALRVLFAPRTQIPLGNGDTLRVRADTGPYAGQLQQSTTGFAVQPLTIPLRLRTANVI